MINKADEIKDRFLELKDDEGKLVYDGYNAYYLGFLKSNRYKPNMNNNKRKAFQQMGL